MSLLTPEFDLATDFAVDVNARTIYGLAVPYGVKGKIGGQWYQFSQGSLSWSDPNRIKLLIQHDKSQAVGKVIALDDTPQGLFATFKVARGEAGDRALALAEDGVFDGLSVGLHPEHMQFSRDKDGTLASKPGNRLIEISLTPVPVFDDARVSAVVAEADTERSEMTETPEAATPQFDMSALADMVAERLRPKAPEGGPEVVEPNTVTQFEINEPDTYVFDRHGKLRRGAFDLSEDLAAVWRNPHSVGGQQAHDRVIEFMQHQFDVDQADVNEVNPSPTRADLYVNQRDYEFPLWAACRKGTLTEATPFIVPKFSSSSGLVADHTEGTEPTPGAFVTTGQTVTPTALSGKVEITREVLDAGGSPNVTDLIWNRMVAGYYEAIEAKIQATLVAAAGSITNIDLTAGGGTTGQTAFAELGAAVAALQYVRGGFVFNTLALQIDLYKLLVGALDGNKRPLFPVYGPQNTSGQLGSKAAWIDVFGVRGFPAWALEPTGTDTEESWLFDSNSVGSWASAPQRLNFQSLVEQVELAVWGYQAHAVLDTTGVREIQYDPVP